MSVTGSKFITTAQQKTEALPLLPPAPVPAVGKQPAVAKTGAAQKYW